ncbi:MAG TPA: N-methyl-L-tryptophan oxidase [Burkholderiaceae bacterium]|nr:N-methyl-L-tryptophan oxidase [Burkholderiaceae bacterium]
MTAPTYDIVVAGLGAMGSATVCELSRRGLHVLGLDRHAPPHAFGSSHGETRIIREAYFEHPVYVPLVQRAFELWRGLERASGTPLLRETGGLMIGRPDSALVEGALRSARLHNLTHEVLTSSEVRGRFPALRPDDDMVAVHEPRAGILFPEACIGAFLARARRQGAELHGNEALCRWESGTDGLRVYTEKGEYRARRLIVCAGAWVNELLPGQELRLHIERQVLHWFEPVTMADQFAPERCPIHLWQFDEGRFFYGFPDLGGGVKAGFHHEGEITSASDVRRSVTSAEVEAVRSVMRRFLPGADGPLRSSIVCLYTNTPDGHFLIDTHPLHPDVLIASPCSGHGFKFAPVIGEILADLAQDKVPRFDLTLFRRR